MSGLVAPRPADDVVIAERAGWPSTEGVPARALQVAVAAAIVPVAVSVVLLAITSDHVEHPTATALYFGYLAVASMLVGLYWWRRRPASRFGSRLVLFGLSAWAVSWQSSDWALAFDLGVLAEAPAVVLTFYLFLAFPSGRLTTLADRLLICGWTVVVLGFYVVLALASPELAGRGPLSRCVPGCPENVLNVGSAPPELLTVLGRWQAYLMLGLAVAVLVVYTARLLAASRPRRRALIAVAATSLLFLPAFFAFHFSRGVLELDPGTLEDVSWLVVGARILLPLGFLVALLQADLFAGVVRGRLLEELATKPTPERWRDAVARALDDPVLRVAYWDPASGRYRQADGDALAAPTEGRAVVEVDGAGQPVAAMDIDAVLAEDPELVQAAGWATKLAIETGDLEGELRDSQARIVAAGDAERRRIERDLHDSAQQRLIALRIHLALASEYIDGAEQRNLVEQLGSEVDGVLDDLRSVASGEYPVMLRHGGTAAALRSVSRHAAIPVRLDDGWRRRHGEEVERAVYFCCLEALQNAAKHAGAGSTVTIRLTEDDGHVGFAVEDDGVGYEPSTVRRGAGLQNISDRVSAVGGTLRIDSAIGKGTCVSGRLPG